MLAVSAHVPSHCTQEPATLVVGDLSLYLKNILSPLQERVDGGVVQVSPVVAANNPQSSHTLPEETTTSATATRDLPKKKTIVLPCVIYYPDENAAAPSWANTTLGAIGYNKTPEKVQGIIDRITAVATKLLNAETLGLTSATAHVKVVPLSKALDGKRTEDYVARVEPSVMGGHRMAELIWNTIKVAADPTKVENVRH